MAKKKNMLALALFLLIGGAEMVLAANVTATPKVLAPRQTQSGPHTDKITWSNAFLWAVPAFTHVSAPVVRVKNENVARLQPITVPRAIRVIVPRDEAKSVAIYAVGIYTFLGPRGWTPSNAIISEDGSGGLMLTDPANRRAVIAYSLTPACVGCAIQAAAQLFPDAAAQAGNYGSRQPIVPLFRQGYDVTTVQRDTKLYSKIAAKGWFHAGIVTWRNPAPAWSVSMTLPVGQKHIATAVLRAFAREYGQTAWPATLPHHVT